MSGYRPYDEYEPNDPAQPADGTAGERAPDSAPPFSAGRRARAAKQREWTTGTWERPMPPERAYTQRTWDEEDYLPNEPQAEAEETREERTYADHAAPRRRAARTGGRRESRYAPEDTPYAQPENPYARGADSFAPERSPYARPESPYARGADSFAPEETPSASAGEPPAQAENPYARNENPYARPTWDETSYANEKPHTDAADAPTDGEAYGRQHRAAALHFDADADTSPNTVYAAPAEAGGHINPYARPENGTQAEKRDWSERYAPPLKFDMPDYLFAERELPADDEPERAPNVYRTRKTAGSDGPAAAEAHTKTYRVEADAPAPPSPERKKHTLRRWLIALCVLAVLGGLAYLERDWLMEKLKLLLGEEAVETVQQAVGAEPTPAGYDAAPSLQAGDRARKGINAVAGGLGLETAAVTASNIVCRVAVGGNAYDFYLFASADGKLLGYYDNLPADGFLVCPNDVFYVAMPPYLINSQGRALVDTARYAQAVGDDPVLGPMINGWALISDPYGSTYNYINADGEVLSTLWFAVAYPFTGNATLAYVDTGNVTDPEARYTLYELTPDGGMDLWRHTADTEDVLGCACGVACMADGELILLDGQQTVLCETDDVSVYADCGAVVARDPQTGLYGLYVGGELHDDFLYDSIAPNAADGPLWQGETNGMYTQYTVAGVDYPLPLSHYFQFTGNGTQETVALSTVSVYPLLLSLQQ